MISKRWKKETSRLLAILQMIMLIAGFSPALQGQAAVAGAAAYSGIYEYAVTDSVYDPGNTSEAAGEEIAATAVMEAVYLIKEKLLTVADAHVFSRSSNLDTNYGSNTSMDLKEGGTEYNRRIYLKFNVSQDGLFNHAVLRLRFSQAGPAAEDLKLYAVEDDSWTESGITYRNAPVRSRIVGSAMVGGVNGWYEWDVTDYILEQAEGDGIASLLLIGTNSSSNRIVSSKESGANAPQLILDYDAAPPELSGVQVGQENRELRLEFNEPVYAVEPGLPALKNAIRLSRNGEESIPLGEEDMLTIADNTLIVTLAERLAEPGARLIVAGGSLQDKIGNRIAEPLVVDPDYDAASPVLSPAALLDETNMVITVGADEELLLHVEENALKSSVSLAEDGHAFRALNEGEAVALTDGEVVVTLADRLEGSLNRIKIAEGTLKDGSGNLVHGEYISDPIAADSQAPQLLYAYAVHANKKAVLVFDEPVYSTGDSLRASVSLSRNGGTVYRPLSQGDQVYTSGSTVVVSLEDALSGLDNRIAIHAGALQDILGNTQGIALNTEAITAGSLVYPYTPPHEETLEQALQDSQHIVFGNKDAATGAFSELHGSKAFEALVQALLSGNDDPALAEQVLMVIRKMLTQADYMPNLQAGLDSRAHSSMVSSLALLWHNEEIMGQLTEQERSSLITFFKAALFSTIFSMSPFDQFGDRRTGARLAMNGDPNTYTGNPNYWEPNLTLLYASSFVLGTENVKGLLEQYSHAAFMDELDQQGLVSVYASFANLNNFGTLEAKAAMVEGIVRNTQWFFQGVTLNEFLENPMLLYDATQRATWDGQAQDGEYMGQLGMEREFHSSDASGPRESANYAILGIDPALQNRVLMHYYGYWNAPGNEEMRSRIEALHRVGVADYYAKTINGYYSQSRGGTKTEYYTGDIYIRDTLISVGELTTAAFHDSFDYVEGYSHVSSAWVLERGDWQVRNEVIVPYNIKNPLTSVAGAKPFDENERILAEAGGGDALVYTKESFADASAMVWVRIGPAGETGIAGRVADGDNYYSMTYADGKLAIKKRLNGAGVTLTEKPYIMTEESSYRFRGVFEGERLEFYVNGVKELEYWDDALKEGGIGLVSNQASGKFDGILVQYTTMPKPELLEADFGDGTISLAFAEVKGALHYLVHYGTEPGHYSHVLKTTRTSPVLQGLANDTLYYVAVSAVGRMGEGPVSNELSAIPRKPTAVAPVLKSAIADGDGIIVDFSIEPVNTSYSIRYGPEQGSYLYSVDGITASPVAIPVPVSQKSVYMVVVPWNTHGAGLPSNELSVIPNGTVLFQDDFETGNLNGMWQLSTGSFSLEETGGNTRLKTGQNDPDRIFAAGGAQWKDYKVSSKLQIVNPLGRTNEQYLLGRVKDYNNYYLVGYKYDKAKDTETLYIRKKFNGLTTVIAQHETALDPDREHLFQATFEGDQIKLYVNGVLEAEAVDGDLPEGTAGILSGMSVAYYDDFRVELLGGLDQPEITAIAGEHGGVRLSFTPVEGAEGYRIKYGLQSRLYTKEQVIEDWATGELRIGHLDSGEEYYFTVSAYGAGFEGSNGAEASVRIWSCCCTTPTATSCLLCKNN